MNPILFRLDGRRVCMDDFIGFHGLNNLARFVAKDTAELIAKWPADRRPPVVLWICGIDMCSAINNSIGRVMLKESEPKEAPVKTLAEENEYLRQKLSDAETHISELSEIIESMNSAGEDNKMS